LLIYLLYCESPLTQKAAQIIRITTTTTTTTTTTIKIIIKERETNHASLMHLKLHPASCSRKVKHHLSLA
jgi:alcohol dehydrogenase class IV